MISVPILQVLSVPMADLAGIFSEACARAGAKQDTVAAMMGITATQLSQQIHGRQHLSLNRFIGLLDHPDPLGRAVVEAFVRVLCEQKQLETTTETVDNVLGFLAAVNGRMRMLKARLDEMGHQLKEKATA